MTLGDAATLAQERLLRHEHASLLFDPCGSRQVEHLLGHRRVFPEIRSTLLRMASLVQLSSTVVPAFKRRRTLAVPCTLWQDEQGVDLALAHRHVVEPVQPVDNECCGGSWGAQLRLALRLELFVAWGREWTL